MILNTEVFSLCDKLGPGYEQVVFCENKKHRFKAIISIHSTQLGPSLGGLRLRHYKNEKEALSDVLKLSKGMSYKASACGLNLGGGKAVILLEKNQKKNKDILKLFAENVHRLNGRYITAKDMGTETKDIDYISQFTPYVAGLSHGVGDPSPYTAYGILQGIKACVKKKFRTENLDSLKVNIQGVGAVGSYLAKLLYDKKALVKVSDNNPESIKLFKKKYPYIQVLAKKDSIYQDADVFSPCATGGIINKKSLKTVNCPIIAGGANNQLEDSSMEKILSRKKILYAPDFLINSGGLIAVATEFFKKEKKSIYQKIDQIYHNLNRIFEISDEKNISVLSASNYFAEKRFSEKKVNTFVTKGEKCN